MQGTVRIYLDGPRERAFDLPDNWSDMSDRERSEFVRPIKDELANGSLAWEINTEYDEEEEEF